MAWYTATGRAGNGIRVLLLALTLRRDLLTVRFQAGKFSKIFARCARRQILIQILENPCLGQFPNFGAWLVVLDRPQEDVSER